MVQARSTSSPAPASITRRQAAGVHPALRRARRSRCSSIGLNHRAGRRRDRVDGVRPVLRRGLAGVRARRRPRRRRAGRAVLRVRAASVDTDGRADRRARGSRSGRPTRTASTTSSTPSSTPRADRGHLLTDDDGGYLVLVGASPTPYPIPHDGPVGELLTAGGPRADAPGAHPLHGQRARLRRR